MITFTQITRYGCKEFKDLANKIVDSNMRIWKLDSRRAKKRTAEDLNMFRKSDFKIQKWIAEVELNMTLSVLR